MGNICFPGLPGDKPYENITGQIASFGMQCFWDPDAQFGVTEGVIRCRVGYSGGTARNPNYENICDHTETIEIEYNPNKTSYQDMLDVFWKHSDPFTHHNAQYQSVIFYHTHEQKRLAEQSFKENQIISQPKVIITKILPASKFYPAEHYHQKFRLQLHTKLMKMLNLSKTQLVHSHIASRLNGYVCRFGTLELFETECHELALTNDMETYVRAMLSFN